MKHVEGKTVKHALDVEERNILSIIAGRFAAGKKENYREMVKYSRLLKCLDSENLDQQMEARRMDYRDRLESWRVGGGKGPQPQLSEAQLRGADMECVLPVGINAFAIESLKAGAFVQYTQDGQAVVMSPAVVSSLLSEFGLGLDDTTCDIPEEAPAKAT